MERWSGEMLGKTPALHRSPTPFRKWRKASVMLRPRLAPILFSRQVQPAYICLPSKNGQGGRSCTCDLLVPNPDASGLLTLHPENGCQGWTRTNTVRFNKPSCYFDTTWQWRCRQEFHLHRSV